MNKKSWKTETWVGIFLLAGIAMVIGAVLSIGDFKSDVDKTYPISILYKNASGLIKGSQLKSGGAVIGVVTSNPELTDRGDAVVLHARINKDVKIQSKSKFNIEMQGMLGGNFIDVEPPFVPSDEYIQPGEFIIGESETDLTKIKNNAMTASQEVVSLLRKLDKNSEYIEQAIKDISKAARDLSETTRKLNHGILSDDNVRHLAGIMRNVDEATAQTPQLIEETRAAVATLKATTDRANILMKDVSPALQEAPLMFKSFKQTSDNVSSVVDDVKKGNGAMGLLLYDRKFKKDFEDFVRNLRDYGILRYRDPKDPTPSIDPRSGYSGSRR